MNIPNIIDNVDHKQGKDNLRGRTIHLQSIAEVKKNSSDNSSPNLLYLKPEDNNLYKPKCKAIKMFKKVPLQNEHSVETVTTEIEISTHVESVQNQTASYDINEEGTKGLNNNNESTSTEVIDLDNGSSPRISKRPTKVPNFDKIFVKKRKECKLPRKIEGLEKNEKLFIRLIKLDFFDKSSEVTTIKDDLTEVEETPAKLLPLLEKPTKKISKTEVHKKNLMNINKTESLKMEQLLLEKFKKAKEKQANEDSSKEELENSTNDVEPYVYEKTTKPIYETYKQIEDENGQVILCCLLCPFTGEGFRQMSLHYKFKHRDTPIEEMHFCEVKGCNFKAVHKGMFKWHMRRHMLATDQLIANVYPCSQCNKVFEQRKSFLIHLKLMHKDPALIPKKTVFPCATCKFTTTAKQNLQAHIYRSHIPDNIKPTYTCNLCGYKTHYKDCLRKHLTRVHLQEKK